MIGTKYLCWRCGRKSMGGRGCLWPSCADALPSWPSDHKVAKAHAAGVPGSPKGGAQ